MSFPTCDKCQKPVEKRERFTNNKVESHRLYCHKEIEEKAFVREDDKILNYGYKFFDRAFLNDTNKEILRLVLDFFKGNQAKTKIWFRSVNPLLGNVKPIDMINIGRSEKLMKFVVNKLDENKR